MRAWELLKATVLSEPTYDDSHPFVARHRAGKALTLRALHKMRLQKQLRELELAAHKQFAQRMYTVPEDDDDARQSGGPPRSRK